jgi:NADH-quinone oxidoreductase subunit F
LTVPPADAFGVASFYALFSLDPRPPIVAHVCDDIACLASGGHEVCEQLEQSVGHAGSAKEGSNATWLRSPCLGLCDRAPAALVVAAGERPVEQAVAPASGAALTEMLASGCAPTATGPRLPQFGDPTLRLLRRVGVVDPSSLEDYRARGGYRALRRALELGPEGIIREVLDSRLLGRGGAAFPTGRKWEAVARAPERPHYLVCNADESEPGTFKDRVLMEEDPFAVLEAMTIAAYATGCRHGYLYIRGEYPSAAERLLGAFGQARVAGLLGEDILGRGFPFDVELRRGAGAYICGEETALFSSIEGRRGEPRNKPPFPVRVGLFGKPTVVNNVETLVNVLDIVMAGGPAFASVGTAESTGTRLFCLSGCVRRPGLYELSFGATLGELLDLAGGVGEGRVLQAILLGGAAGTFVTPDRLDLPLTFEATRAAGTTLGSGAIIVFDDTIDLRAILLRIAEFFRDESCGQCVPCRVGTARQEELLHRLAAGRPRGSTAQELALLNDIGSVMRDASICGLGHTAASAIESALARLPVFEESSA